MKMVYLMTRMNGVTKIKYIRDGKVFSETKYAPQRKSIEVKSCAKRIHADS